MCVCVCIYIYIYIYIYICVCVCVYMIFKHILLIFAAFLPEFICLHTVECFNYGNLIQIIRFSINYLFAHS